MLPEDGSASQDSPPKTDSASTVTSASYPLRPFFLEFLDGLDITQFITNPEQMHEFNFNNKLQPEPEGEDGRQKQVQDEIFWTTLKQELNEFVTDSSTFYVKHGRSHDWTLPKLLAWLQAVIKTFVHHTEHQSIDDCLDIQHLMQQFSKGVADLEKLAKWLSQTLLAVCAPVRDEYVAQICNQISQAGHDSDVSKLVNGMRSLFDLLVLMTFDIINERIRNQHPALLNNNVESQKRYWLEQIESGKFSLSCSKAWYKRAKKSHCEDPSCLAKDFGDSAVFFEGFCRLILPSSAEHPLPGSFLFDTERINQLRSDILDCINLEICMTTYRHLESESSSTLAADAKGKAQDLYQSLDSLLQSAKSTPQPADRWQELLPHMATEILRFIKAPPSRCIDIQEQLESTIGRRDSTIYRNVEGKFHKLLVEDLSQRIPSLHCLSGYELFSVTSGRFLNTTNRKDESNPPLNASSDEGTLADISLRVAQMGILNVRYLSELVYIDDEADDSSRTSEEHH